MQLLRARASVTAVSLMPEGTTALHLAANGHLEAVDALLKHGSNPFVEDGRRAPFPSTSLDCPTLSVRAGVASAALPLIH